MDVEGGSEWLAIASSIDEPGRRAFSKQRFTGKEETCNAQRELWVGILSP